MKQLSGLLVCATVTLIVAANVLPRLTFPIAMLFGLTMIGRCVWWYTR